MTAEATAVATAAGALLLLVGTVFCVLGVVGLLRLADLYNCLHAAGMVLTVGAAGVLLSLLFLAGPRAGLKALATAGFLSITAPMVTHVLTRTAYRQGLLLGERAVRDDLAEDRRGKRPASRA